MRKDSIELFIDDTPGIVGVKCSQCGERVIWGPRMIPNFHHDPDFCRGICKCIDGSWIILRGGVAKFKKLSEKDLNVGRQARLIGLNEGDYDRALRRWRDIRNGEESEEREEGNET